MQQALAFAEAIVEALFECRMCARCQREPVSRSRTLQQANIIWALNDRQSNGCTAEHH